MTTQLTAAEKYRQVKQNAEIVDVTVPSGFVFQFAKPSAFGVLFTLGSLPQSAASQAAEAWQSAGIIPTGESVANNIAPDKQLEMALDMCDRVMALSHSPKIVAGKADESKNEISAQEITRPDLEYLFKWVAAGGDTSLMLATFPDGSPTSSVVSPNRKTRRAAAKSASRH